MSAPERSDRDTLLSVLREVVATARCAGNKCEAYVVGFSVIEQVRAVLARAESEPKSAFFRPWRREREYWTERVSVPRWRVALALFLAPIGLLIASEVDEIPGLVIYAVAMWLAGAMRLSRREPQ